MKNSLTIAISTYKDRILDAVKLADKIIENGYKALIVHQGDAPFELKDSDVDYYFQNDRGVSKSRNIALAKASTEYLWFMDDDCEIDFQVLNDMLTKIYSMDASFYTFESKNPSGLPRKKYFDDDFSHNLFSIHRFGTIEVIVKVNSVNYVKANFPEDMGAGAVYPLCDEPVFLSRLMNKGLVGKHIKYAPVIHDDDSSGLVLDIRPSKKKALELIHGKYLGFIIFKIYTLKQYCKP